VCCTRSDGRTPCVSAFRNCSTNVGFNTTNNFAYLVCNFDNSYCGEVPISYPKTDYEYDGRFGRNFVIARDAPVTIATKPGFNNGKRCTYVIRKSFFKTDVKI
jgi:hypothetical protein